MVPLVDGLPGAVLAAIVITAFMLALGDGSPPPRAALQAKYVGAGVPGGTTGHVSRR